ncbi:MAG: hypothetical protein WCF18_00450, partial [Chthoniobacteraceae bacterium]
MLTSATADDFSRLKPGDFDSADWYNEQTMKSGVGPPGAGDNALIGVAVTASGGSVNGILGQGPLTVSGTFNCSTVSQVLNLQGAGKLVAGSGGAVIRGGHLEIGNFSSKNIDVVGGSVIA